MRFSLKLWRAKAHQFSEEREGRCARFGSLALGRRGGSVLLRRGQGKETLLEHLAHKPAPARRPYAHEGISTAKKGAINLHTISNG